MRPNGPGVFVSNLSYGTTVEELKALAEQFGRVQSCKIPVDPESGTLRGFGFVYCRTPQAKSYKR